MKDYIENCKPCNVANIVQRTYEYIRLQNLLKLESVAMKSVCRNNGVHSALVRINEELLERKIAAPVYKTEINDRGGSAALATRHPSTHKSCSKFRQQVAVDQSVYFVCGLNATEFACFMCRNMCVIEMLKCITEAAAVNL
jgi:hypothetical protein